MHRYLTLLAVLLLTAGFVQAHGLLIPENKTLPPLAMLSHKVGIQIDDQVGVTRVEQVFRNHTDRPLEATYVFPVPKGASVDKFTMWVDGKEVKGELLDATQAKSVYESIVRRTQDPGLLEYMDHNLFRLRVFPVPAKGDQKVALSYKAILPREGSLVEYVYPLKTDGKSTATLETFAIDAVIKSQHAVQNVYSPTHALTLKRASDREVTVQFERNQGLLDKDFQLFYQVGDKDVGLTAMLHRPVSSEPGYFMFLVTPRVEIPMSQYQAPRDVVFVLDTSGSMAKPDNAPKIDQAKKALKVCLDSLGSQDRFALIHFGHAVNNWKDGLVAAESDQLTAANKWVQELTASGGTNIDGALSEALKLRSSDDSRTFTVLFFTDGQPTIGETNPERILKNVVSRNTGNTRIFTLGIGDDVNATLLDSLADRTRALTTYIRPEEDIAHKTTGLLTRISHPVLTNLKLSATNEVRLTDTYPPQLPDLFHGQQLVVVGRYTGSGPAALRLTGMVGKESKEFSYDLTFADRTDDAKDFVEPIWARRKVGYLLDEIRANGEHKELVDEVVKLAKRYGITTPYTSWLIVPDGPMPVAQPGPRPMPLPRPIPFRGGVLPPALAPAGAAKEPANVIDFARRVQQKPGDVAANRDRFENQRLADGKDQKELDEARLKKAAYDQAAQALREQKQREVQAGKLGVDLSVQTNNLRNQERLEYTAQRNVNGRSCVELGGVWIDEGFDPKMPTVVVKAQSDAYFRILERQKAVRDVFRLGNHVVWVAPNGTALVIDSSEGKEKLSDDEIDQLFVAKK